MLRNMDGLTETQEFLVSNTNEPVIAYSSYIVVMYNLMRSEWLIY